MILRKIAQSTAVQPVYRLLTVAASAAVIGSALHSLPQWQKGEDPTPSNITSASTGPMKFEFRIMVSSTISSSTAAST